MPRTPRAILIALGALLSLGTVLRLLEYFNHRPLWLDESMLALNVGMRGFGGLVSAPLDYDQAAAPLFLWGTEAASLIGGMNEYALRFLPLLAGVLLPWMVWRAAIRIAGAGAGLIAASLAALSVPLIYYSAEVKPYGLDALAGAGVIALTVAVLREPEQKTHWHRLLAGGGVAILVSVSIPFILAGALAALATDARVRAAARSRWLATATVWAVLFAVLYVAMYRPATTPYLERFWASSFLQVGAGGGREQLYLAAAALFDPLPPLPGSIAFRWYLLLAGVAALLLIRRAGLSIALLIGIPILAVGVASALGLYPMSARLLVFLAPSLFLLCGAALAELLSMIRLRESAAALVGAALVLLWGVPAAQRNAQVPWIRAQGREAARIVAQSPAREPVYVTAPGIPIWAFYSTDWSRPDTARLRAMLRAGAADGPSSVNDLIEESPGATREPIYSGPERLELLGRRSGVRYEEPGGYSRRTPHPAWAAREVDRMVAVARPYLWVYGVHWIDHELPDLQAEFARRGIVIVESWREVFAAAVRIRVPAPGSAGYLVPGVTRP